MIGGPVDVGGREIRFIDLHHEGAGDEHDSPEDVARGGASRGFNGSPYNILIWRPVLANDRYPIPQQVNPWRIEVARPFSVQPASVHPDQAPGHNAHAIAVCVAGRWDREPLPRWAQDRVVEVCVWLCRELRLSADQIRGHREICRDPRYTVCPGYDVDAIRERVRTILEGS